MIKLESLVDGRFSKGTKGVIILIFLVVPFVSSIISMIHVVRFLDLGNTSFVSITLAITYEVANLTILMAVVLMKKLRAVFVWLCFCVLLIVQIVGNVYYSYDYILTQIVIDKTYLNTFVSFLQQIVELEDSKSVVFILSWFLGLPIPMVSLFLVKSVVDYLEVEGKTEEIEKPAKSISFEDTSKLVDQVIEVIKEQPAAEKAPDVINREEKSPTHLGVIIKPDNADN